MLDPCIAAYLVRFVYEAYQASVGTYSFKLATHISRCAENRYISSGSSEEGSSMIAAVRCLFVALGLAATACVASAEATNPFRVAEQAAGPVEANPFRVSDQSAAVGVSSLIRVAEKPVVVAETIETPEAMVDPDHRPMTSLGVNIALPSGKVPAGASRVVLLAEPLAGNMPRPWPTKVYQWEAAATRHQPLYFEEINAERYGYSCNWVFQPFVSTAHFFGTIPALPYLKATNCPSECQYTLGHYRAGSCPPYQFHCWPVDCLGGAVEAGSIAWLIVVLP